MSISRKAKRFVSVETFDSDDERTYSKEKVPDSNDPSYYYDELDEFHQDKEKVGYIGYFHSFLSYI